MEKEFRKGETLVNEEGQVRIHRRDPIKKTGAWWAEKNSPIYFPPKKYKKK